MHRGASPTESFAVTRTTVKAIPQDWTMWPETNAVVAGQVTFHLTNHGEHPHGFVILKTDLAADSLPATSDGEFDVQDKRVTAIGKIEALPVGETEDLTVSLKGGWYFLADNVAGGLSPYQLEKGLPFFAD